MFYAIILSFYLGAVIVDKLVEANLFL